MSLVLTREQRAGFFQREYPKISGEGKCPVEVGYVHVLSKRVSFEVTQIRRNKRNEWSLAYTVYDQRGDQELYLLPTGHHVPVDEHGRPLPMTRAEERGYTTNPKTPFAEDAAVPFEVQTVLTMQGRARTADLEDPHSVAERQGKQLVRRLRRLQGEAVKLGVDITPRLVAMMREAEAELAEKRNKAA